MTGLAGPRSQHAEKLQALVDEDRYRNLVRLAVRRLRAHGVPRSAVEPEDVVHAALESVLAAPRAIHNVRKYLYACLHNEIKQAARRYAEGKGYASLDADVRLQDELAVQPIAQAELRLAIEKVFGDLPLQQRRVMLLTRELGMTQAQAAQLLGIAQATVGVHAHRAVQTLRVALVGLGTALVAWTTWSTAFGIRTIIPAAGPPTPLDLTVTRGLFLTIGFVSAMLGLTIYLPAHNIPPLWRQLLQRRTVRKVQEDPAQESEPVSEVPSSDQVRRGDIDPADQWVLNPNTGEYELRLPLSAQNSAPSSPRPGSIRHKRPTSNEGRRPAASSITGQQRRSARRISGSRH